MYNLIKFEKIYEVENVKKFHYCVLILFVFFTACSSSIPLPENKSNKIEVSVSNIPDFTLNSSLNTEKTELTITVESSIPFNELTWSFDGKELSETGSQTVININSIKKGVYNLIVTGIYNGIVYSAEMIITIN